MSKHNKNTIIYMFSRLTRRSVDIFLERKCAPVLDQNGSCLFMFVCETTVVVLIPQPDLVLHWSWNYPSISDPFSKRKETRTECWKTNIKCFKLDLFLSINFWRWSSSAEVQQEMMWGQLQTYTRTHSWGCNQPQFVMNINDLRQLHSESTGGQQTHYTPMTDP